jgi:hypothetical protein
VLIAPSDYRGREQGPRVEGTARLVGPEAEAVVVPLLRKKYGWQRYALELAAKLRRSEAEPAYIEIS